MQGGTEVTAVQREGCINAGKDLQCIILNSLFFSLYVFALSVNSAESEFPIYFLLGRMLSHMA